MPRRFRSRSPFELLPSDIIHIVFDNIDSFGDLNALISASPTCLRLFNKYPISTITQVAKNVIEDDAWADCCECLVYQRNPLTGTPLTIKALREDLKAPFIIQKPDISHLITNQRWYRNTKRDILIFLALAPLSDDEVRLLVLSEPSPWPPLCPCPSHHPPHFLTTTNYDIASFYHSLRLCYRDRCGDDYLSEYLSSFPYTREGHLWPFTYYLAVRTMRLTFVHDGIVDSTFQRAPWAELGVNIETPSNGIVERTKKFLRGAVKSVGRRSR